jgi:hypothetical protein
LKQKILRLKSKSQATANGKRSPSDKSKAVSVDLKAICSIDHECVGCSEVAKCCCAKYDVSVTEAELKKIIPVLPEAAKFCPHLKTENGYANVFEEGEDGLHSIDTHENGLCVFAFKSKGLIRCSLHAVEISQGLPLGTVKPKMCVLWPLTFSEKGDTLTLHDNALSCACSSPRKIPSRRVSPALLETIRYFSGEASTPPG